MCTSLSPQTESLKRQRIAHGLISSGSELGDAFDLERKPFVYRLLSKLEDTFNETATYLSSVAHIVAHFTGNRHVVISMTDIEITQGTSWFLVCDQGSTNKTFLSRGDGGGRRQLPSNIQSEVCKLSRRREQLESTHIDNPPL